MLARLEGDGPIATLVLDRPEARNALSIELCDHIVECLSRTDDEARVVVLRGAGKAFCAGADLNAVSGPQAGDFLVAFERMLETVARFRLPTIAAIHGAALGGGFQLATVCDFRIAAADAKLGIPASKLGIVVNLENVQRLVALCGPAVAKEVLMSARVLSGADAEVLRLVTESVPPDGFDAAVTRMARSIASLAPLAVQGAKEAIQLVVDHMTDARSGRPNDAAAVNRSVMDADASDDLVEGMRAAAEKRPPRFSGR